MNKGGSISGSAGGLKFRKDFAPSPYTPNKPVTPARLRPNQGGTITRGGVARDFAPSPAGSRGAVSSENFPAAPSMAPAGLARGPGAMTPGPQPYNQGGSITTSSGLRRDFAPTPYAGGMSPAGRGASSPPVGAIGATPQPINDASRMGFRSRGNTAPRGDDIVSTPGTSGPNVKGVKKFTDPKVRNAYDDYAAGLPMG